MANPAAVPKSNGNKESFSRKAGQFTWDSVKSDQFALEFLTASESLSEAISHTTFRSKRQLAGVIEYARKLIKFKMVNEIECLILFLNGRPAIGGFNRAQAIMAGTGIPIPEAIGVPLSKKGIEILKEYARRGQQAQPTRPAEDGNKV